MTKRKRWQQNSLARQIVILLIVVIAALSVVIIACTYSRPDRVFMENIILKLIFEKHSKGLH
ncbi:hypothetical protein [Acetomicrobium sp.]|uniref:hypothetical protein n=1 Tax=Acetomicrobium sp. TaxID=1872099 RepID=UPI002872888E|nr:hypothetical protein [Acetomicrobium sp.]MDR9770717.1 hypothetical protein [Acetomicrobium sp.]